MTTNNTHRFRFYSGGLFHRPQQATKPANPENRSRPLTAGERLCVNRKLHTMNGGGLNMLGEAVDEREQLMPFELNPQPDSRTPASKPQPEATPRRKISPGEQLWIARKLHGSSGGLFNCQGQAVNGDESLTTFEAMAEARGVKASYRR